jgi:20S proteasome subunit beta 5
MNAFADRFSQGTFDAELRKAKLAVEDDDLSDAMWGSEAGFGSLVNGHSFNVPAVPDVSFRSVERAHTNYYAFSLPLF